MNADILKERQGWTLNQKIDHSLGVIDQFVSRMDKKVYVAFSGGKDSSVLLRLCEMLCPNIKAVFVNTGCEYPDIVRFVESMKVDHNIEVLRPSLTPRAVWSKYGFPLVSKEVAEDIHAIRTNPSSKKARVALGETNSIFALNKRWRYLIHAEYDVSNRCCYILKKLPSHKFQKLNGLSPILGILADESLLREKTYIRRGGCNHFGGAATSWPLAIWTDENIWDFVKQYNVRLADIYYKGVERTGCVACGFGCQFKRDRRLEILYKLYPKYYNMIMNFENNGVKYRNALRIMLGKCGLVLPDEDKQLKLFQ